MGIALVSDLFLLSHIPHTTLNWLINCHAAFSVVTIRKEGGKTKRKGVEENEEIE
jgi:hypothetical protein